MLSLLAAGIALFVLLLASYSGRGMWITLGSATLSMAALIGLLFLVASQDPSQVQTKGVWIANELSLVADQKTVDELRGTIERLSAALSCSAGQKPGCSKAARAEPPAAAPAIAGAPAMQAAATPGWLELQQNPEPEPLKQEAAKQEAPKPEARKQEPGVASQSPVIWRLYDSNAQVGGTEGFSISGTNISNQALEQVQAVLKPDSNQRELQLTLEVDGQKVEAGLTIPAGTRFSLVSENPSEEAAKPSGGAILSFRYVQAGKRKTSILYLTPAMVARFANR